LVFKPRIKKKKKAIFVWVANISRNPEHALASIRIWCKYFANIELVDTLIATESDSGEGVRKSTKLLDKAFNLGVLLTT